MEHKANFSCNTRGYLRAMGFIIFCAVMVHIAEGKTDETPIKNPHTILHKANHFLGSGDMRMADSLADVLISKREQSTRWVAQGWSIKGIIALQQKDYKRSIEQFDKALSAHGSWNNDTLYFDCLYHMGLAHKRLSYFVVASSYLYTALEHGLDSATMGEVHNVLGNVQRELKNYEASIGHHRKANKMFNKAPRQVAKFNNNLGKTFLSWGKSDSALYYFRIAETISGTLGDTAYLFDCYSNMAMAYARNREFELAKDQLDKVLSYALDSNALVATYLELGNLYIKQDSVERISDYLSRLNQLIGNDYPLSTRQKWHMLRSKHYELLGNYQGALAEFVEYQKLREASLDAEAIRSINEWETHFQSEQLRQSLKDRKAQLELTQIRNQLLYNQRLLLFIVVLVVVLIAYSWSRRAKRAKAHAQRKEALFKELNHRVSNNLSSLSGLFKLQLEQVKGKETRVALQDGNARLEALNLVHTLLEPGSTDALSLDLDEYLESLVHNVLILHDVSDIFDVSLKLRPLRVPPDQAILFGLIVNEVITNACKYALVENEKPLLEVVMLEDKLIIKDNGKGFPKGVDPETAQSTGLELIRILSDQLHTSYRFSYSRGLVFEIAMVNKKGEALPLP